MTNTQLNELKEYIDSFDYVSPFPSMLLFGEYRFKKDYSYCIDRIYSNDGICSITENSFKCINGFDIDKFYSDFKLYKLNEKLKLELVNKEVKQTKRIKI